MIHWDNAAAVKRAAAAGGVKATDDDDKWQPVRVCCLFVAGDATKGVKTFLFSFCFDFFMEKSLGRDVKYGKLG